MYLDSEEVIPDADYVYRQATPTERTKANGRRFPNESHFQLRPYERGLSVNWERYISVQQNFELISLTHNRRGKYLDYVGFRIFKYPVEFLRSFDQIADVIHTPEFNGVPAPIGKPNNQSHSEILCENDIELQVKLSDYCRLNNDQITCDFDVKSINERVDYLRNLLDTSEYHMDDWSEKYRD